MKRPLVCLAITAFITVFVVVPFAYTRPGGSGGPVHQPPNGGWRGAGGYRGGWGGWDRRHRGDRFGFFFYGAFPLGWPYYCGPPHYAGYYYDSPPAYYESYNPPTYYYDGAYSYPRQDTCSYSLLGHDWGKDLRLQAVTWDWFVQYVRAYIINAPPGVQDDFRRGFVDGYGESAASVLSSAMQQAQPPPVPPPQLSNIITSAPAGLSSPVPAQRK